MLMIGREDSFNHGTGETCKSPKEIRTTGWVVVRFIPRPTGIRWILSSHPIPPLLLLPGISLSLTLTSAIIAFLIITYFSNSSRHRMRGEVLVVGLSRWARMPWLLERPHAPLASVENSGMVKFLLLFV